MDIKNFKEKLFEMAKKEGFSEYELFYSNGKSLKVSIFKGELEKFSNSKSGGVSFRGIFNGKMGYSFCEKIDENTIPALIKYAKENAQIISEDEKEEIYKGDKEYKTIKTFYEDIENIQVDEMIKNCLEMEKAVLEYDSRIVSCNNCAMAKSSGETYIANSKGLELSKKGNFIFAYTGALAKENEETKSGMELFGGFDIKDFDAKKIGQKASQKALACLGAKSVGALAKENEETKSGMELFGGFDIKDFDAKKIGQKASQKALACLGAKSVPSGKYNIVFENECFTDLFSCFIGNFYAENVQKGFSLFKDKLNTQIASNLINIADEPLMENGYNSTAFDSEGVACYNKNIIENGILTTENGILTTPVEQITIAGNYFEMLKNIKELANDLKFATSGIGTPSVFAGKLDISGE